MSRKGQKSLEMIIGLVILLVVAGVVISTFLSQFQDTPGDQYDNVLEAEEISRQCTAKCADYKDATGIKAQTEAIDYCTSNFVLDENGDGTIAGTAGVGYNRYCEDGVKCFHKHTCETGSTTLNAERCAEIMKNYYTSSQIDYSNSEAESRIAEWYKPGGEGDKTIGTCGLEDKDQTWYSTNFAGSSGGSNPGNGGSNPGNNNQPPQASISSDSPVSPNQDFGLDASGSTDSDGSISSYEWDLNDDGDFGDATGETASKSEGSPGDYTVAVKVTDSDGATDTATETISVSSGSNPGNNPPTAQFGITSTDLTVDVDGSSSTDDDQITSYSWSFGDGSSASGETASHTYNSGGTYTIELEVTDNDGATDTTTQTVSVSSSGPTPVSQEDQWCEDNTNSDAVSEGNNNINAGCKNLNDLTLINSLPPGAETYKEVNNPTISCSPDYRGYVCED